MGQCKRCTAPNSTCEYWCGTFCSYDLEIYNITEGDQLSRQSTCFNQVVGGSNLPSPIV